LQNRFWEKILQYGQFCPVAKASEIIGEKWTLLIIRELLMGGSRFSELQRGLSLISPTVLTKRLGMLEERGLVIKKKVPGLRGHEYFPTESCKELLPIIEAIGHWGMRWARKNLTASDYDVELLMTYLKRSVVPEKLPGKQTVIRFKFTDIVGMSKWWLMVDEDDVDICVTDPGRDVDLYFTTTVKLMADIWMGDTTYRKAVASGDFRATGLTALLGDISAWMPVSIFADLPSAKEI
jgi:DNA-binding HxlR family transcriptional regulator